MKVLIRRSGFDSTGPSEHELKTLTLYELRRFRDEVSRVVIFLEDVNGPYRGGVDKRCQVVIAGPRIGTVAADELGVDAFDVSHRALLKVSQAATARLMAKVPSRPPGGLDVVAKG